MQRTASIIIKHFGIRTYKNFNYVGLDARVADIVGIVLFFEPLVTLIPLASIAGHYAGMNDVKLANTYYVAHYLAWEIIYLTVLAYYWYKFTSMIKEHIKVLEEREALSNISNEVPEMKPSGSSNKSTSSSSSQSQLNSKTLISMENQAINNTNKKLNITVNKATATVIHRTSEITEITVVEDKEIHFRLTIDNERPITLFILEPLIHRHRKSLVKRFYDELVNNAGNFDDSIENDLKDLLSEESKNTKEILEFMQNHENREIWFSSIIGFFYQYGIGCEIDKDKSLELYLLAIKRDEFQYINNIIAKYLLALFYYKVIDLDKRSSNDWNLLRTAQLIDDYIDTQRHSENLKELKGIIINSLEFIKLKGKDIKESHEQTLNIDDPEALHLAGKDLIRAISIYQYYLLNNL
ncbi:13390_t:CDS:2 [Funneliformis caledonium]|uniref:13390_t:CDS:1 n=1 Tax=Funneliformis caledonium TaxID=1117310 RepID=A0A9N8ZTV6_9GLOM|nr:13390_t:CDS:2 [Funneliformis caledonium]